MNDRLKNYFVTSARRARRLVLEMRAYAVGVVDEIDGIVASAGTVNGWVSGTPAKTMALASYHLPDNATVVEVGVFMGRSTVLLAAPRRLRGNGKVHSVDAFDCSGDDYSSPHYASELKSTGLDSLEAVFRQNLKRMKLDAWVDVHKGSSSSIASMWKQPIDLLLLDGDHSQKGAREAYEAWIPFLKLGGIIVLQNTGDRVYGDGHDGNRRLSLEVIVAPLFSGIRQIEYMTFAVKVQEDSHQGGRDHAQPCLGDAT
jgi:MMP 1-O-methyltransferase